MLSGAPRSWIVGMFEKRPGLISVMHAVPLAFSLTSAKKTQDASGSRASMASMHICMTCGSYTILETAAVDDTPLGTAFSVWYERRLNILAMTGLPRLNTHCTMKSLPGRYSASMNDRGGRPRISSQYAIQARACAGV